MNVIFDLGNVVLDWNTDKIIQLTGLPDILKDELKSELFLHQDWLDLDCGCVTELEVIERVCGRSSLTPAAVERALNVAKKSLTPISESIKLMKELENAGLPLYCLSNMSVETYEHLRHQYEFFDSFRGIVISGIEKLMKPDKAIFELTLARHSLLASETLFIDDSLENIEAANAVGVKTHLFRRTDSCYETLRSAIL